MDHKKQLQIFGSLFNNFKKNENKLVFEKIILKDKTEIQVDKYEVGSPVLDAEGNPAKDGEYEKENGEIIVVKDGLIAEIKAVVMAETPATEVSPAPAPAPATDYEERIKYLELNLEKVIKLLNEILGMDITTVDINEFSKVNVKEDEFKKVNDKIEVLEGKLNEFSKTPKIEKTKKKIVDNNNMDLEKFARNIALRGK